MSSYGRAQEAATNVLEAFGVDPGLTATNWYKRTEDGEKRMVPLDEAITDAVYDTAYQMGIEVAKGRMQRAIAQIINDPDDAE